MAAWKLALLALKARRGWKRLPPEQRKRIAKAAGKQARKHGPIVAKRVGTALKQVRKAR
jgi:TRAP-type C4-dicarboxylate transport system substrate-binding protein